jgi:hypothetical protein
VLSLDVLDVRLEYIAYIEEESDFLESRLSAEDILFSFLFAPVSPRSPIGASRQPQIDTVRAQGPGMVVPGLQLPSGVGGNR